MTIDYDEMCLVLAVEEFQRFTFHMHAALPILGLHFQSEFALFLTSLLLYHFIRFVKCVGEFFWSYF